MMAIATPSYTITWEKLPVDYILPDDPVDNINQPSLAAALTDSLQVAGKLTSNTLTTTNYGICATVNQKMVIKAPDWSFIPQIRVPRDEVIRSYTPQLQGDVPAVVMEFLSDTEGAEYSSKPTYPQGKWFFYEKILKVPNYVIFEPNHGEIEVYHLGDSGEYALQPKNEQNRYWIPELNLFLGIWEGIREQRQGYWLRWWTADDVLLLWSSELAESEKQRADRLMAQLRALGVEPE